MRLPPLGTLRAVRGIEESKDAPLMKRKEKTVGQSSELTGPDLPVKKCLGPSHLRIGGKKKGSYFYFTGGGTITGAAHAITNNPEKP